MRFAAGIFAVCLAASANSASAQWVQMKGSDDPFAGRGAPLIALSMSSLGTSIGFRCTNADDLTLLLVTPESPSDAVKSMLSLVQAKILIIIDDQEKVEIEATADVTPDGKQIRFESDDDKVLDVLHRAASAKRRVAAAVELMGKPYYSYSYQASNSRRALQPLISGCKLPASVAKPKVY